jgi:RNA recognition motif-containing protein
VQLAEELKTYKLENLEDINLVEDPERKGKNRGYAFLDFRTNVDGVDAFFKLQNRDIYLGTDVRAQVSFSKTLSLDDKIMEKVKSVFLDGLPPHWDEDKVREVFGKFGEIDSIHLARNMFKAKRKDFGFIGFTSRQSALDCISTVSKGGIVEGSGKVIT